MEELYSIMRQLLEIEYHQKSLIYILDQLDKVYRNEQSEETVLDINAVGYYLKALQQDFHAVIGRMDVYLADHANR